MRTLRHLLLPLFLVSVLVPAAASPARAADESTSAQAREHYQKGTSFYDLGKYNEAIREFEQAYELKNDPALLYNLAQSHRLAGNPEQALRFYRTYLRYVPKAPNRAEIDDRIKQLETLVNQKNAAQTTPPNQAIPPGGSVTPPVTTTPPANTPVEPVQPVVPPAGGPTATTPLPPEYAAPAPGTPTVYAPPLQIPNDHHTMIRAGAIVAGVGAGLFIVGAIYGAAAKGAATEINNAAASGGTFDPKVEERGKNAQKAEAALMTLGVVSAAAGAGLFFYGRHAAAQERAVLTPVASSTGGGLSLRVTF